MNRHRASIAVANGKGGVGKTTVTANVSALWAAAGFDVIAVDLDPQANLAAALGLDPLDPTAAPGSVATGRPNLRYATWSLGDQPHEMAQALRDGLDDSGADLAVIDTPPSASSPLADAALAAARWLLIPARCDRHSVDGIATLLRRALAAGDGRIDPLGVALFAVNPRATSILADTRAELVDMLGDAIAVLDTTIRAAERAQTDAVDAGITAAEYALLAESQVPWYQNRAAPRLAGNAAALAKDYSRLATELGLIMKGRP